LDATDVEWVTAIATAAAAAGTVAAFCAALFQIGTERKARHRQETEIQQRDRRSQAERISAWPVETFDEGQTPIALSNRSEEPVYRAVVLLVMIQGAGARTGKELVASGNLQWLDTLTVIPPGDHFTAVQAGWGGMMRRPGVEVAFTDRAGLHWLRRADGSLAEISKPPVEYYALGEPIGWSLPQERR
jgi:hypothetical protein